MTASVRHNSLISRLGFSMIQLKMFPFPKTWTCHMVSCQHNPHKSPRCKSANPTGHISSVKEVLTWLRTPMYVCKFATDVGQICSDQVAGCRACLFYSFGLVQKEKEKNRYAGPMGCGQHSIYLRLTQHDSPTNCCPRRAVSRVQDPNNVRCTEMVALDAYFIARKLTDSFT